MSVINGANHDNLENMLNVLGNADKFPPYPQNFEVPYFVRHEWIYLRAARGAPILKGFAKGNLEKGDQFNGIVVSKKRKKGLTGHNRHHRVHQFLYHRKVGLSGQIIFKTPISGSEIVEKGKLRKGEIYRFEIINVNPGKKIFNCAPLAKTFDKDNWIYNLTHCNYQKSNF